MTLPYQSLLFLFLTIFVYQGFSLWQKHHEKVWLNPMLLTIGVLIPILLAFDTTFAEYKQGTFLLHQLLDVAIVALGFPLYQQLNQIKQHWKVLILLLTLGVIIVIVVSFTLTMALLTSDDLAIALSLKSITTPIALTLIEDIGGNTSVCAFAIVLAGVLGAVIGPKWLSYLKVSSPISQGLAIGAASHAIGTSTISKISYEHGAYGSLALIVSAVITALISPTLISLMVSFYLP